MALHNPNNWHWINKDVSPWAEDWFRDNCTKISAEEGDVTAKISEFVSMKGDVDVSQRKGKVITIYDLNVVLEYSGSTPEAKDARGTITFPEVEHDTQEDEYRFEIEPSGDSKDKQPVHDLVRSKIIPQLRALFVQLSPALIAAHGKDIQHAPGSNPSSGFSTPKLHAPTGAGASSLTASTNAEAHEGSAVNTTTMTDTAEFKTTAGQLFQTFTDPQRVAAFTHAPPKKFDGAQKGGKFELFDGNVSGEFLELQPPTKIVQSWRLRQWPVGHFSRLELEFKQNDTDGVTVMHFTWSGVPVGQEEVTKRNWDEYYVRSIKKTFGFGSFVSTF